MGGPAASVWARLLTIPHRKKSIMLQNISQSLVLGLKAFGEKT